MFQQIHCRHCWTPMAYQKMVHFTDSKQTHYNSLFNPSPDLPMFLFFTFGGFEKERSEKLPLAVVPLGIKAPINHQPSRWENNLHILLTGCLISHLSSGMMRCIGKLNIQVFPLQVKTSHFSEDVRIWLQRGGFHCHWSNAIDHIKRLPLPSNSSSNLVMYPVN